jgi:hypothetical protein
MNKSRSIRLTDYVARMEQEKNMYLMLLFGTPEEK